MTKNYTDEEILNKIKSLPSFAYMPEEPFLVFIRSNADKFNEFDDYAFLFEGEKGEYLGKCTTNPGGPALLGGWKKYTKDGAAIIKDDEIYYKAYQASGTKYSNGNTVRKHNGKMHCLRQIEKIKYYRDKNNDKKVDKDGPVFFANYSTNIHFNSYRIFDGIKNAIQKWVGEWSYGCIVLNDEVKYEKMWKRFYKLGKPLTVVVLSEF